MFFSFNPLCCLLIFYFSREGDSMPVLVQKTAFCDAHAPPGAVNEVVDRSQKSREESRNKMKQVSSACEICLL